jgi:hypothetical protein
MSGDFRPERGEMAHIDMVLAAGPGQPGGDVRDRITLHAALTGYGYLDIAAWFADPAPWSFTRTRSGAEVTGDLVRDAEAWALRGRHGEEGPLWRFQPRILRPGEYVTLHSPKDEELVYRVVSVVPDPW